MSELHILLVTSLVLITSMLYNTNNDNLQKVTSCVDHETFSL